MLLLKRPDLTAKRLEEATGRRLSGRRRGIRAPICAPLERPDPERTEHCASRQAENLSTSGAPAQVLEAAHGMWSDGQPSSGEDVVAEPREAGATSAPQVKARPVA